MFTTPAEPHILFTYLMYICIYQKSLKALFRPRAFILRPQEGKKGVGGGGGGGRGDGAYSNHTLFFYNNLFYESIETEICKILRIF